VVLHEFAHALDQEDGSSDGAPILGERAAYAAWARVLGREYEQLQDDEARHHRNIIDTYGATNPAEFFAVVTETFFEEPVQLKNEHPELYEQLALFYKQDPAARR
jgi:Mlc titration factor MtfA (ptsG expression regulator)